MPTPVTASLTECLKLTRPLCPDATPVERNTWYRSIRSSASDHWGAARNAAEFALFHVAAMVAIAAADHEASSSNDSSTTAHGAHARIKKGILEDILKEGAQALPGSSDFNTILVAAHEYACK